MSENIEYIESTVVNGGVVPKSKERLELSTVVEEDKEGKASVLTRR